MSLPEDLRQEYLETLGIVSYFPRFILPAAPPPEACDWPESWTQPQPVSQSTIAEQTPEEKSPIIETGSVIQKHIQATNDSIVPLSEPRPKADSAGLAATVKSPEKYTSPDQAETGGNAANRKKANLEDIRLQLLCIRVNENLAILNAMPHFGPGQLSRQHMALLQNMLQASGVDTQSLLIDEKPFHWPMVQGEYVDNSKSAAAAALIAFLQQKLEDWQFKNLLIMGEQVVSRLFIPSEEGDRNAASGDNHEQELSQNPETLASDTANDSPPPGSHLKMESQIWETFYARSLDEVLHTPMLKKEIWSIVRKIRH